MNEEVISSSDAGADENDHPNHLEQPPQTPSTHMIAMLTGIAMLSGFLVVLTAQITAPMIAENQRIAIEKAIQQVVPGAVSNRKYRLVDGQLLPLEKGAKDPVIYAGYDDNNKLLGIAAEGGAQGYAGMVNILYGYDPKCECIKGFKVLKMAETPGLGDKIITDANFQANFPVDARVNREQGQLTHPIITVKNGSKKNDWEIDAITGATITSRAVGKALNQSAQKVLPELIPLIDHIKFNKAEQ